MSDNPKWCNDCWVHHWDGAECFPEFRIRLEDEPEEWVSVRAPNPQTACVRWAGERDAGGDWDIVGQRSEPKVIVRNPFGDDLCFIISGEAVPEYHAQLVVETGK